MNVCCAHYFTVYSITLGSLKCSKQERVSFGKYFLSIVKQLHRARKIANFNNMEKMHQFCFLFIIKLTLIKMRMNKKRLDKYTIQRMY